MRRNIKLTLAYDGSDFSGWQVQPEKLTIQGLLAEAIERATGERVLPQGSGRTDAGVHALAQVCNFHLEVPIPLDGLRKALNRSLPGTIRVLAAEEAPSEFHSRHDAKSKTYEYRLFREEMVPAFEAKFVEHHPYPLDEQAMIAAAGVVVGEHDFTSFAAVDPEKAKAEEPVDNVRTIFGSEWERRGPELVYTVSGSGFLHHMVRNLVGTFLLVGRGAIAREEVVSILAAKKRSANPGQTAGAKGLYLVRVEY